MFILYLVEIKRNILAGQFPVYVSIGSDPSLDIGLILGIKVYLEDTLTVNLTPSPLSVDFSGVYNIIQNCLMDGGECTRPRPQSRSLLTPTEVLSEDGTLGNDQYLASGELLLEFTYETNMDLLEGCTELVGYVEDDGLTSPAAIYLLRGSDVKVTERGL